MGSSREFYSIVVSFLSDIVNLLFEIKVDLRGFGCSPLPGLTSLEPSLSPLFDSGRLSTTNQLAGGQRASLKIKGTKCARRGRLGRGWHKHVGQRARA